MGSEYFSAPKEMAKMGAEYIFPLMPSGKKEIVMRLLIRLVSLAVAAYSCYSGAVTGEWKASIAIISLCALMFLITIISKALKAMAPQRYTHQAVAQAHLVAVMAVVEIAKTQWGSEYFFQYLKYSDPQINVLCPHYFI